MVKKAATPAKGSKVKANYPTKNENPLFEKRPRVYSIGGDLPQKKDLSRIVRYPKYIKLQRQRRILLSRLRVPPTINQFSRTLDKTSAQQLFKLLLKYRPETKVAKKKRMLEAAKARAEKKEETPAKKPMTVKFGINHVTTLVEQKKAKLVVIAHDVDPIELVVWLPTLCRKMDVPYVVIKGKSRLGSVVHQKTATAVALTDVSKEDANQLKELSNLAIDSFNKNTDLRKVWGGGRLGNKRMALLKKRERAVKREEASRQKAAMS